MGVPNMNAAYDELDREIRATWLEAMARPQYGARSGPLLSEIDVNDTNITFNFLLDNYGFRKLKATPPKKAAFEKQVTLHAEPWQDNLSVPERELNSRHGDKYRMLAGARAKQLPRFMDGQVARLLKGAAFSEDSWDGVPYFSTAHPMTLAGGVGSAFSNYDSGGASAKWFLFDTSVLGPIAWFWKQRPEARDFGPDSEHCRLNHEVLWNFYLDCGLGMTLWHFGYASNQTLDETHFVDARQEMLQVPTYEQIEDEDQLMGVMPNLLVVGASNQHRAEKLLNQLNLANGESNSLYKAIDLLVLPMLP